MDIWSVCSLTTDNFNVNQNCIYNSDLINSDQYIFFDVLFTSCYLPGYNFWFIPYSDALCKVDKHKDDLSPFWNVIIKNEIWLFMLFYRYIRWINHNTDAALVLLDRLADTTQVLKVY